MKRTLLLTLAIFSLLVSYPAFLHGQEVASLTGVVTDKTGAVIPDVDVKLVDTRTNASYETKTNSVGAYTFSRVLPGPGYKLIFTKDGFDTSQVADIYLAVSSTHTQNGQLEVGKVSQVVEVNVQGAAVSLDTTDAAVTTHFDMNMVHELPIQTRDDPSSIMRLQPGVVSVANTSFDDPNQSRDGSITGARSDQSNITLDGLDVVDFAGGFAFGVVGNAPVDSVQEVTGETANPLSAEGRGSGAQISMVTKSGSNQWHGSAYEYNRNTDFDANSFFNNMATPVVPRSQLVENQFGTSLGGPIMKDKLFFFFNYSGRRNASQGSTEATVPLDSFRDGNLSYINTTIDPATGAPCGFASRVNVNPTCISTLTPAQVAALDPAGIGGSAGLLTFINDRYPHANDLSNAGDGVNTGGFRFNVPENQTLNNYVLRLDYNLNSKMKLFARGSMVRFLEDGSSAGNAIQFPGDPLTYAVLDHSYSYVFGHTWTISNNKVNQFTYGETRSVLRFPDFFNPTGTTNYAGGFDSDGVGGHNLSSPYLNNGDIQNRVYPIPIYRDDFTYTRGNHTIQFGGTFKPITTHDQLISDVNSVTLGLSAGLTGLSPALRPADIRPSSSASAKFDSAFAFLLGRIGEVSSAFNLDKNLQPLAQGTGHIRDYRYLQSELYFQDSWKIRPNFTMTYGLRYQYDSVPYETHGLQAIPSLGFDQLMSPRIANGLAGISGDFATPFVSYSLGGKANDAPAMYRADWKDFQPRVSFSYNPSATQGFWGHLLGERKTVVRFGAAIINDTIISPALQNFQDQNSYILQSSTNTTYGFGETKSDALKNDPRFTTLGALPAGSVVPPTAVTLPFTPNVDNGVPDGLLTSPFDYAVDPRLKTPYSQAVSFGIQRELPGHFLLETTYVGRFARRLLAQSDAMQTVDFKDPASNTLMGAQFAQLSLADRNGAAIPTLPWFENQVGAAAMANYGMGCADLATAFGIPGVTNCSTLVPAVADPLVGRGDLADTIQNLFGSGLINSNVGLPPQLGTFLFMTNKGFSNYNGLLTTLHKTMSHGFQFDVNYTYSHSLDNISAPANEAFGANGAGGILCDSINIHVCYGNSDFDITHAITADGIFALPFGRGRAFGSGMARWADEVVGGWMISGIWNWHSGFAYTTVGNAFPISFANNVPAVFNGDKSAIKNNLHVENGQVQIFADPAAAIAAYSGPLGLQAGSRNNLRGPGYSNFDFGLSKHFPITERVVLEFRADAFNAFNHPNFVLPGTSTTIDITDPSTFGVINGTANPREIQLALRLDF